MFYIIDLYVLNLVNNIQNPFLDIIMLFFTFLGNDGFIWIIIILTMLFPSNSRKYSVILLFALPTVLLITNKILKDFFQRGRPFHDFPDLRVLVETSGTYSFPSSHTSVAFTVLGIFIFFRLKYKIFISIIAFGIALSRIYLNVHYFLDILSGIFLGVSTAYFYFFLYKKHSFLYMKNKIIKTVFIVKKFIYTPFK